MENMERKKKKKNKFKLKECVNIVFFSLIRDAWFSQSAHRNQHTMKVSPFLLVSVGIFSAQKLPEPLNPRNAQDGDAAVAAEGLQQREVDLQSHIVLIVSCQDAQDHIIWISERDKEKSYSHLLH